MLRFKNLNNFVNHFQGKLKHNMESLSKKQQYALSKIKVTKKIIKKNY